MNFERIIEHVDILDNVDHSKGNISESKAQHDPKTGNLMRLCMKLDLAKLGNFLAMSMWTLMRRHCKTKSLRRKL